MHTTTKGVLITPYNRDGDLLYLRCSKEDAAKVKRGCRWQATVRDLHSGWMYVLRDASCGIPGCHCAARIVRRFSK